MSMTVAGAAGLLVLTIIAILAFLTAHDGDISSKDEILPEAPAAAAPSQPATAPAPDVSPASFPSSKKSLVNATADDASKAAAAPLLSVDVNSDDETLPTLAPTPEEAITKKVKKGTRASDPGGTDEKQNKSKQGAGVSASPSDGAAVENGKSVESAEDPSTSDEPKLKLKLRSNPYADDDEDEPGSSKKNKGDKKKSSAPVEKRPKKEHGDEGHTNPIDDNPFSGN
jgi:hypothetical protein